MYRKNAILVIPKNRYIEIWYCDAKLEVNIFAAALALSFSGFTIKYRITSNVATMIRPTQALFKRSVWKGMAHSLQPHTARCATPNVR